MYKKKFSKAGINQIALNLDDFEEVVEQLDKKKTWTFVVFSSVGTEDYIANQFSTFTSPNLIYFSL